MKCNIDAAIFAADKTMGIGAVLRDDNGGFVAALQMKILHESQDVKLAEAIALRESLNWLLSYGIQNVIMEVDLLLVLQYVSSDVSDVSHFGLVI